MNLQLLSAYPFQLRIVLFVTLAIKLVLAAIFPMSGDEAYFLVWANHPDLGYYDHPPMVGWWLQFMLLFGHSEWLLRLPAVLLTTLIGMGIFHLAKPYGEARAALAAMLYLASPLNVLNVLITTDTPLILFIFLSAAALARAIESSRAGWFALSGAFLGLAFLSKYFSVLIGGAYLVYWLMSEKSAQKNRGFLLLFASALPFVFVNVYWNYTHCWDNILFNIYNRNAGEEASLGKVAIFFGTQLYLMTPPLAYYLYRHRAEFASKLRQQQNLLYACAFVAPMALFALLSLKKTIGLHWVLAFYPFFFLLAALWLTREELRKAMNFMIWFCAAHVAAVAVIAFLPMETWKKSNYYDGIVFMFENDKIADELRPYEQQGFVLMSDGYTPSAILSYHYGKNFPVFGLGSQFARQDDIVTDFREFAGRDLLVLNKSAPVMALYTPYFRSVEVREITLRGIPFYLVLGYGFDYETYKKLVLKPALDMFYRIPEFLPHAPCYFCEKYFPEEAS